MGSLMPMLTCIRTLFRIIMYLIKRLYLPSLFLLLSACAVHQEPLRIAESFPSTLPVTPRQNITIAANAEEGFNRAMAAYREGDGETTLLLSRQVLDSFPDTPWYKRSLFLMEQALIRLDRSAEADAAMLRVQAEYPEMADYALFMLAEYHFSDARFTEAAALYQQVTVRNPDSLLAVKAAYRHARSLLESYSYSPASEAFAQFLLDHPRSEFAPDAGLGLGRSLTAEADLVRAVRAYQDVWIRYPGNSTDQEVETALAVLRGGGADVPEPAAAELYERGKNLYRSSLFEKAVETFSKLLERDPHNANTPDVLVRTGIALYNIGRRAESATALEKMVREYPGNERIAEALNWLGKSYSKLGDREKSIKTFHRILNSYPACEWADDALFYIGNVYRESGDMKKAIAYYARLAAEYPDSHFADSSFWWQAWAHYIAGDFRGTEQLLQEMVIRYPRSFLVNQARYWQGRSAEKAGSPTRAVQYYRKTIVRGPYSYYGYRAAERMAAFGFTAPAVNSDGVGDAAAFCEDGACLEDPVETSDGDNGPPVWTEEAKKLLSDEPSYKTTLELMYLDMKKEAAAELWALQETAVRKRGALIALSKAFFELGDYHRSLMLVLRNYDRYLDGARRETPGDFWLLAYPQGYWDSIVNASKKHDLDPLYIAAIIREESQFRAEALSPAGARGVMQVMPATGEWIAQTIRLQGFNRDRLFDPDAAITVGVWYVAHLMKRFNNDPLLVAAAYNAGPEAVASWLTRSSDSQKPDEFVEQIPFSETRGYVKKVLRNYAEYRRIYGRPGQHAPFPLLRNASPQAPAIAGEVVKIP